MVGVNKLAIQIQSADQLLGTLYQKPIFFLRLGEMYVGDKNINLMMVDDSLAVKYEGQNKADIEAEHLTNRQKLIDKGLFDPSPYE